MACATQIDDNVDRRDTASNSQQATVQHDTVHTARKQWGRTAKYLVHVLRLHDAEVLIHRRFSALLCNKRSTRHSPACTLGHGGAWHHTLARRRALVSCCIGTPRKQQAVHRPQLEPSAGGHTRTSTWSHTGTRRALCWYSTVRSSSAAQASWKTCTNGKTVPPHLHHLHARRDLFCVQRRHVLHPK